MKEEEEEFFENEVVEVLVVEIASFALGVDPLVLAVSSFKLLLPEESSSTKEVETDDVLEEPCEDDDVFAEVIGCKFAVFGAVEE